MRLAWRCTSHFLPRQGSAAAKIIDGLLVHPVFSVEDLASWIDAGRSSLYSAIERLHEAEVIRPLTKRDSNQVWIASALSDELDDLG